MDGRDAYANAMQTILYLHGWGARQGGFKPTFLAQRGYQVLNPTLPDDDFEASVAIAQRALVEGAPDVVVGSSRGGAVAMRLPLGDTPCVLIAPAWRRFGTSAGAARHTIILHSPADDLVPLADSQTLLQTARLPEDRLVVVGEGHYMTDHEALEALVAAIARAAKLPASSDPV